MVTRMRRTPIVVPSYSFALEPVPPEVAADTLVAGDCAALRIDGRGTGWRLTHEEIMDAVAEGGDAVGVARLAGALAAQVVPLAVGGLSIEELLATADALAAALRAYVAGRRQDATA